MATIGIPVYPGVDLLDFAGPHEMFGWVNSSESLRPGDHVDVQLLSEDAQDVTTRDGVTVKIPHSFADAPQLDVVWVPGGDPEELSRIIQGQGPLIEFLKRQAAGARFVCSVCEGAMLLAAAGLLDGHKATTHWAFIPCLKAYRSVTVVDGLPRFVESGNRLTGGGISSGLDEALRLIELLTSTAVAEDVQRSTQYFPSPPVSARVQVPDECEFAGLGP
jgi:transcriptional regulator GlxA family with amidase domain